MRKNIVIYILLLAAVAASASLAYRIVAPETTHEELSEYYIAGNTIPSVTAVVGQRKMTDSAPTDGANFVAMRYTYQSDTAREDLEAYLAALVGQAGYTESPKREPGQTSIREDLVWQAYRIAQDVSYSLMVQAELTNAGYTIRYSMSPRYSAQTYDFGEWQKPSLIAQDDNLSTDTRSSSFGSRDEKLMFLSRYLVSFSEILDAEYHVFYSDNSKGMVPGPSHWDIRAALKLRAEDIPLWLDGYAEISPDSIDLDWWEKIRTDDITWPAAGAKFYKRPDSLSFVVVFEDNDVILKRVTVN